MYKRQVLIHGLVRDAQGRKMSKSLGNGIDPLEVIEQYGADALRFALATGNSPGNDMRFSDEKVEASRNFANKIWNAARFILMNLDENEPDVYKRQVQGRCVDRMRFIIAAGKQAVQHHGSIGFAEDGDSLVGDLSLIHI